MEKLKFDGYPLQAVREGDKRIIYTHDAVQGQANVFATTDTDKKALMIVNKINFFDDVMESLVELEIALSADYERGEEPPYVVKARNIIAKAKGESHAE